MFKTRYTRIVLPFFYVADTLGVTLAFFGAYYVRFNSIHSIIDPPYLFLLIVVVIAWSFSSLTFRSYRVRRTFSLMTNLSSTILALLAFVVMYTFYVVGLKQYELSRLFHVIFLPLASVLMIASNIVRFKYVYAYRARGGNTLFCLLLLPKNPKDFDRHLTENDLQHLGYQINHILHADGAATTEKIERMLDAERIDALFVLNPFSVRVDMDELTEICDNRGVRMKFLTPFSKQLGRRLGLDHVAGYPVLDVRYEPLLYLHNRIIKRGIDTIMAILSIIFVLSWLPIVVKLAQMIWYPGPLFFKQERVGRNNKIFYLYKFRTMYYDPEMAEKALHGEAQRTSPTDARIPWFGRLLRRTNLDEYPQFINVLLGSMSVVGPRPHMKGEDDQLARVVPKYRVRRYVKPGITGRAQINGYRGGTDDMDLMRKRTEHDIWYVENWSVWLDIKIIFITIWQMMTFSIPKAY